MKYPLKLSFHSSSRTLTNTIFAGETERRGWMKYTHGWMDGMKVDRPTLPIAWQGLESACRHSRAPSLGRRFIFLVLPMRRGHLIRLLRGFCGDGEKILRISLLKWSGMVEFRGLPAWGFAAVIIYITRVYSARWIGSFVSSSFVVVGIELLNFAENRARVSEWVSE